MADVIGEGFGGSMTFLNGLRGKEVVLEMMNGEIPGTAGGIIGATHSGVSLVVRGVLKTIYDDALVIQNGEQTQLVFARAIRAIREPVKN